MTVAAGAVYLTDGTGIACLVPLPDACARRADTVRDYAVSIGLDHGHSWDLAAIAYRLGWDAHAAAEYPRAMLADACDVANIRPALSQIVWHHVAGATILGRYCCGTPAAHRDALVNLAGILRREVTR